jgi:hypothetical protein
MTNSIIQSYEFKVIEGLNIIRLENRLKILPEYSIYFQSNNTILKYIVSNRNYSSIVTDLMFTNDNIIKRIDENFDVKFNIKAILEYISFNDIITLKKNYSRPGLLTLNANLNNSGTLFSSQIVLSVTESN